MFAGCFLFILVIFGTGVFKINAHVQASRYVVARPPFPFHKVEHERAECKRLQNNRSLADGLRLSEQSHQHCNWGYGVKEQTAVMGCVRLF